MKSYFHFKIAFSQVAALAVTLLSFTFADFPASASATVGAVEKGKTLRILPLGDSITRGSYLSRYQDGPYKGEPIGLPSSEGGGYRKPLQDKLRKAGIAFDFVGELSYDAYGKNGVIDPSFDPDHQGLAGFSNSGILNGGEVPTPPDVLAKLGIKKVIAHGVVAVLDKYKPDIVLLMSGGNGFDANARNLLIQTIGEHSTAFLVVATITPQKAPRIGWEKVEDYNQSLPDFVAARRRAGQRVGWVDMQHAVSLEDLLPDGTHPNKRGLEKISEVWFKAIKDFVNPSAE